MNRSLLILSAVVATDMIGFGIVIPLLPFYSEALGATPFDLSLIVACYPAAQLLAFPVVGRLSDLFGRKRLILLSLIVSAVSYLAFGLADTLSVLLGSRIMAGLGGATFTVAQAYVADTTDEAERTSAISKLGGGYGVGLVLGPIIGGYASVFSFSFAGFTAAAISICSLVMAVVLLPDAQQLRTTNGSGQSPISLSAWARAYSRFPLSLLVVTYFLTAIAFEGTMSMLALFLERRISLKVSEAGMLWAWSGVVIVFIRLAVAGTLAKRLGEKSSVLLGLALLFCGVTGMLFATSFALALCAATSIAAGYSIVFPTMISLTSKLGAVSSQGSVLGGYMLFDGLGRTIGPILFGLAFQSAISMPIIIAAIGFLAAAALSMAIPQQLASVPDPNFASPSR